MDGILLTPESCRTLSLVILNLVIAGYLVGIRGKSEAAWWLAAFTGGMVLYYLMRFIQASLFPLEASSVLERLRMAVEFLVVPVALGAYAQFAYRFLEHPFVREANIVLGLTALLVAAFALHAADVLLAGRDTASLYILYSLAWLGFCALATIALLRKSRRLRRSTPPGDPDRLSTERTRRAYHAFAGLSALFAAILVLILALIGVEPLPDILWALVPPSVFAFFSGLVVVYVNHAPVPTTFQVKLVGLSLATLLAVLGIGAVLLYPPGEMERDSGMLPSDGETIRFEPNWSGGYRVSTARLPLDEAAGVPLEPGTATIPLGFSFPFYGTPWDRVTVGDLGVVVFGATRPPPSGGYRPYRDFENDLPKIAAFFGFQPMQNLADTREAGVFVDRAPGRLQLTWYYPTSSATPSPARVRLVLYENGVFSIAYDGLGRMARSELLGLNGAIRGLNPGGAGPRLMPLSLTADEPFSLPAGTGLIDDVGLRFRRYVHGKSVRLMGLLVAAALFVLLVFPFVFRSGLFHPLERLIEGVRRVNAGERDLVLPVGVRDEIGSLTAHFNAMTRSLRDAEAELRSDARELECRVAERTAALEAGRVRLEEQALRLRELDALKTRFFANISHEFRTPLTLLLGPLQDLLDGRADADRLAHHAPAMHRNALRLLGLINQLLDLARLEAGGMDLRIRRTELVAFLSSLVLSFADRAEREGLTLLFDTRLDSLDGYVDPDKLEKAVSNLLANAFKFTPRGGKVRLAVSAVDGPTDAHPATENGAHAEITVEDTGRGIPPADLPHVFDRFYQVDASATRHHEGTGIGLSLVKELIALHDGSIEITSKVGFGTTFTVRLPLALRRTPADVGEAAIVEESVQAPASQGQEVDDLANVELKATPDPPPSHEPAWATVLLVEDNPDMRALLRGYLEDAAYAVVEARDGAEGLAQTRAHRPDLVLCDVMMPGTDGLTLCRTLKADAEWNHIPVVLLTARADEASRLEGLGTGADDYLTKPFGADELLTRVENLIEVRRRLRERFSREVVVGPSAVVVPSAEAVWLATVRTVVEAHLGEPHFTVDALADEVGVSKRHLQRRLKDATTLSPSGYIRTMRLERAAQLLEQQAGTVSEIAYAVGFNDAEYFSKLFRQVFGVVPSHYPDTI